jgi:hypothetical protein
MPAVASKSQLVRTYIERVVNKRDLAAVDEMVAPDYQGTGDKWPADVSELLAFYEWQASARPDWHIDIQDTLEVGDCVIVHALAGGTLGRDDAGVPIAAPMTERVEWLAAYWVHAGFISRIEVLELIGSE